MEQTQNSYCISYYYYCYYRFVLSLKTFGTVLVIKAYFVGIII